MSVNVELGRKHSFGLQSRDDILDCRHTPDSSLFAAFENHRELVDPTLTLNSERLILQYIMIAALEWVNLLTDALRAPQIGGN